ncbi:MAG TPA: ATP-dependent DNA helicase [Candidatus Dormibacteraeota bacterium]|nr:ATP-dependent DNA helicase [Candidatus Dormibacteraeota bacterium]
MADAGRGLSDEQQVASQVRPGPLRVVAGAGTGKTAVIAARFCKLLEAGVDPAQILVMTFTERAASEMRDRILAAGGIPDAPNVGTFHSMALRWLREEARHLGLNPAFRILTGPERWILTRELMWELQDVALVGTERPDDLVAPILKLMERLKQELIPLSRMRDWVQRLEDAGRRRTLTAVLDVIQAYERRCRREALLDFDELLRQAVRLFEEHPKVRERYVARFPWIMVDEYQDTNLAQERMVELLAGVGGNICVVGDDDQSIYRFRGASRANMERFLASFPSAATVTLGRNRRSTIAIVRAARRLIEHNRERLPKPLEAAAEAEVGPAVEIWECGDGGQEAKAIASEIARAWREGVTSIAVLARTHAIARPLADALAAAGVPYQYRAGQGLFQRQEIRDLVAYLRLLHDPGDRLALARLLVRPPLCLDLADVLRRLRGVSPADSLSALASWEPTAAWARCLLEVSALAARLGVDELLFELLDRTRYLERVVAPEDRGGAEARRISANVGRFAEFVSEYCERRRDHRLGPFVEYLDLVLRSGLDEEVPEVEELEDAVQVMTIHQAKGLEFDLVFVPAVAEGRLPQPRRGDGVEALVGGDLPLHLLEPSVRAREDQVAEERRLCYVAVTRARRRLVLSWAERYEGTRVWRRSRFLEELGPEVQRRDLRSAPRAGGAGPDQDATAGHPLPVPEGRRTGRGQREEGRSDRLGKGMGTTPVLSYSSISAYRECPRQHWYRYQLGLPAPPPVEAQLGSVVHLVLMRAGHLRRQGGEPDRALLQHLYREAWEEVGCSDPRRRPALEALGWQLLEGFVAAGGLASPPALVEAPFTVELEGWTLRGVIDRVDRLEPTSEAKSTDGRATAPRWRIVDYKTGDPVPVSRLRRDLQLALYALGVRTTLGPGPMELEILYLREGQSVRLPVTEDLLAEAKRIGAEVAEGVRRGHFEPRPERRRCSLCGYRLACEAAL